jgi:outer membrane biosynthesis protein TonB
MTNPFHITRRTAALGLRAASVGLRAATLPLRLSAHVADAAADRLTRRPAPPSDAPDPPAVVEAVADAPAPAPAVRPRAAATPKPKPKPKPRGTRTVAEERTVRETDDLPPVGAEIVVAEPWEGYSGLTASQIVNRLADADETMLAAVRLYELAHESREAVLHVTEG